MKKNSLLLVILLTFTQLNAQVSTSTLTPEFNGSGGLSLDSIGNLYIGNFGNFLFASDGLLHKVWKMDAENNLTEYSSNFLGASGNTFSPEGILYQSDIGASGIYKIINGNRTFVTNTGIVSPVGITFDSQGNFFVCNCGNSTIRKVTPNNVSTSFSTSNLLNCPNGITIDEDDNLYVSNFSDGKIIKITPQGVATLLNTTPDGSTSAQSNGHLDYFEPTRTLYIASHASNQIFKMQIDTPSELILVAGSGIRGNDDNEDALLSTFSRPNGVAITETGDSIYINSAIPLTNVPNGPLNPQVIRLITGLNSGAASVETINPLVEKYKLYPNPAKSNLDFEVIFSKEYSSLSVSILDIEGKELKKIDGINTENHKIQLKFVLGNWSSGTYFITIKNKQKYLFQTSFKKQ